MSDGASGRVLLVRHPPVARRWAGRCYGRSDMGWSREGAAMARSLAPRLAAEPLAAVVHSGLARTRRLAEVVARLAGCRVAADPRWAERDFAAWEGRTWQSIWRESGSAMDGMMHDPAGYRPGGGETGLELAARVLAAWRALPGGGAVLVVTHGGPIAALRCLAAGDPPERMVAHLPACGEVVTLDRGAMPAVLPVAWTVP